MYTISCIWHFCPDLQNVKINTQIFCEKKCCYKEITNFLQLCTHNFQRLPFFFWQEMKYSFNFLSLNFDILGHFVCAKIFIRKKYFFKSMMILWIMNKKTQRKYPNGFMSEWVSGRVGSHRIWKPIDGDGSRRKVIEAWHVPRK